MRVAFFTPLSPLRTAIADHSEGLLPHLSKLVDIDLFIDENYTPTNPEITNRFSIYSFREFPARATQYDAILYAVGDNAQFHGYIHEVMQQYPGVVVLHDTTLHRMVLHYWARQGALDGYLKELEYAYGRADSEAAQKVFSGISYGDYIYRYPLIERVVDSALGVIVHNHYAQSQVLRYCPYARVVCIYQHFSLPPGFPDRVDVASLKARWGLESRFVIGSFGLFVPDKRLNSCLRAFQRFCQNHPEAVYLLVGSYPENYDLPDATRRMGLEDRVIITGWMDPVDFSQHMYLLDVGIHLRYPHIGGTPFTPIRLMGLGIPTIVSDIEPLAEFPEGVCIKVPPDHLEEETLYAMLILLVENEEVRRRIGENGARWIREHHDASQIAAQYVAAIEQFVSAPPFVPPRSYAREHARLHLIRESAALAYRLGIYEHDEWFLEPLARAISRMIAGG